MRDATRRAPASGAGGAVDGPAIEPARTRCGAPRPPPRGAMTSGSSRARGDVVARRRGRRRAHAIEHAIAAAEQALGAAAGIVERGPARQAGERRGLGEREVAGGLSK